MAPTGDPQHDWRAHAEDLEQRLLEAERLAALGELVGLIAHEFNNLMTPVVGYTQAALREPGDVELVSKAILKAHEGSARATQIASAILSLARSDGPDRGFVEGGVFHEEHSVEPVRALDAALACIARPLEADRITLETQIEHGLAAAIAPAALQQVLLNLLLNARNALLSDRQNTRRPRVIRFAASAEGSRITIELSDTGPGMPEGMAERVFEPFVSGQGTADGQRGSGLGLTLCRRFLEEAGGSISCRSVEGEGTVFTIQLGRASADRAAA